MVLKRLILIGIGIVTYLFMLSVISPMAANADANVIYSTELGGSWNVKTTWIGQIFPNPSDKVVIQGPVKLCNNCFHEVAQLEVSSSGILQGGYYHLKVEDVLNNGEISSAPMEVSGNIVNNGVWKGNHLYLAAGSTRRITGSETIKSEIFLYGDVTLSNSPVFSSRLNLNSYNLTIESGLNLTILGDIDIRGGVLKVDKLILAGQNQKIVGGKDHALFVDTLLFTSGGQKVAGGLLTVKGNLVIDPDVEFVSKSSFSVKILGDVRNNGVISERLEISGNIENNGDWIENYFPRLIWDRDPEAMEYEILMTDNSGLWQEPKRVSQPHFEDDVPYYDLKGLVNEPKTWKVRSKYEGDIFGSWSSLHAINAGNLIDESKDYVYTPPVQEEKVAEDNEEDDIQTEGVEVSFPDVPVNAYYSNELSQLIADGVIQGYSDGTFKPSQTINRAEVLKIAMVAAGLDLAQSEVKSYSDVKKGQWFNTYIQTATQKKIVQGYSDGSFKPGNLINRAEALKIILLSAGETVSGCKSDLRFDDVPEESWFYSCVCRAEELGILDRLNGSFAGSKEISRAEVVYWVGQM